MPTFEIPQCPHLTVELILEIILFTEYSAHARRVHSHMHRNTVHMYKNIGIAIPSLHVVQVWDETYGTNTFCAL